MMKRHHFRALAMTAFAVILALADHPRDPVEAVLQPLAVAGMVVLAWVTALAGRLLPSRRASLD